MHTFLKIVSSNLMNKKLPCIDTVIENIVTYIYKYIYNSTDVLTGRAWSVKETGRQFSNSGGFDLTVVLMTAVTIL